MATLAFLTPNNTPTGLACFRIWIPDTDIDFYNLQGVLSAFEAAYNWEDVFGVVTPEQAVENWQEANELNLPLVECPAGGNGTMPIGTVLWFAGSVAPTGYLICDGAVLGITTYIDLFNVIGYTYGGADAVFHLPDLTDNVAVGAGSTYALAGTGGAKTHTLTNDEMPTHRHSIPFKGSKRGQMTDEQAFVTGTGATDWTLTEGGSQAHNNMQPYLALTPIIKAVP